MKTRIMQSMAGLLLGLGVLSLTLAGPVTIPNNFTSGTPAVAAEVNANFDAVATAVNDNDSRIAALEASLTDLQSRVTTLEDDLAKANSTIATLQADLAAVQNNSVLALDGFLSFDTDPYGYPRALFSGLNVQLINGADQDTVNGLGNLIIGYNNPRTSGSTVCALADYVDQASCEGAGYVWAQSHKSGSHNLVVGDRHSYSWKGGVVLGLSNLINAEYVTVTGGASNIVSGNFCSISAGTGNRASGAYCSVSGGVSNVSTGMYSSISGGNGNRASGSDSSVSGGSGNTALGTSSSVSGGRNNTAFRDYSSVSGGYLNEAGDRFTLNGSYASVSGGRNNKAMGDYSAVSGGNSRNATGTNNWRAGTLLETQ